MFQHWASVLVQCCYRFGMTETVVPNGLLHNVLNVNLPCARIVVECRSGSHSKLITCVMRGWSNFSYLSNLVFSRDISFQAHCVVC